MNTCPAPIRSRWCPDNLPLAARSIAFRALHDVGFLLVETKVSFRTTNIQFSGLDNAAYILATPGSIHALMDMHTGSLLSRRPTLLRQELGFHPHLLGNYNHFHGLHSNPMTLGLT
jgi:hypothetical protein